MLSKMSFTQSKNTNAFNALNLTKFYYERTLLITGLIFGVLAISVGTDFVSLYLIKESYENMNNDKNIKLNLICNSIISTLCFYLFYKKNMVSSDKNNRYDDFNGNTNDDVNVDSNVFTFDNIAPIVREFPIRKIVTKYQIQYVIEWVDIKEIITNCLTKRKLIFHINEMYPSFHIRGDDNYFNFDINLYLTENKTFIVECKRIYGSEGSYTIVEIIRDIRSLLYKYELNNEKDLNINNANANDLNANNMNANDLNANNMNANNMNANDVNANDVNVDLANANDANADDANVEEVNNEDLNNVNNINNTFFKGPPRKKIRFW